MVKVALILDFSLKDIMQEHVVPFCISHRRVAWDSPSSGDPVRHISNILWHRHLPLLFHFWPASLHVHFCFLFSCPVVKLGVDLVAPVPEGVSGAVL